MMMSHNISFHWDIKKKYPHGAVVDRVAMIRGKYLDNENFFPVREKSRNFLDGQGNLERTWKVREKSLNLKINCYGRQSSENVFICSRGERVYFLRDSLSPSPFSLGATLKRKNMLPKILSFKNASKFEVIQIAPLK